MRRIFSICLVATVLAMPAYAEGTAKKSLIYYDDPVYKQIAEGDEHPMSDLLHLADKGDTRAQFILGDLYAKGKGGLVRDEKKGAHWFEESAKNGYGPSFIRLAALAKRRNDPIAAWSWYDLGSSYAEGRDARYASRARDALEKKAGLSTEDISAARKLSAEFRRAREEAEEKREAAARAQREEAEAKRQAAARAEAGKSDTKDKPANNNRKPHTTRTAGAEAEEPKPYTPPTFTQRYNP